MKLGGRILNILSELIIIHEYKNECGLYTLGVDKTNVNKYKS
jgi:hypothetical protein